MSGEMPMSDELKRRMMAELREYGEIPRMEGDEFTANQFADVWDITYGQAQMRLKKAVAAGRVTVRKVVGSNGRECLAHRIVAKEDEPCSE